MTKQAAKLACPVVMVDSKSIEILIDPADSDLAFRSFPLRFPAHLTEPVGVLLPVQKLLRREFVCADYPVRSLTVRPLAVVN
jgi:hypothetical protein